MIDKMGILEKTVKTFVGNVTIDLPRDQNGTLHPVTLKYIIQGLQQ